MRQYKEICEEVLASGVAKKDRTGIGTISKFGVFKEYDLREGFPLLTTKRVNFEAIVKELLWFIRGETNIKTLGCKIWDEWADENGDLGPIYGEQWRSIEDNNYKYGLSKDWKIDQLSDAIDTIKNNPNSRRIIVSSWNVAKLKEMRLPPCHILYQFYVEDGCLDLMLYQRSGDVALGIPFNIASYSLLLTMVAQECGLEPRFFKHMIGDCHIYQNHIEGIKIQLERYPRQLPTLTVDKINFFDIQEENIHLTNYTPYDQIKFEVAV